MTNNEDIAAGFDIGTTTSCAANWINDRVEIILEIICVPYILYWPLISMAGSVVLLPGPASLIW